MKRRNDEGVALLLALVFIALLTVLVVEFGYETQVEASFAANQGSDFEAYLAAKSAVARGIGMLQFDTVKGIEELNTSAFDSTFDPWAIGQPFQPINEALMRATVVDEYGKLNLNALFNNRGDGTQTPRDGLIVALNALLAFVRPDEEVEEIAASILDWLDFDDDKGNYGGAGGDGAESEYYNGLENPFPCKNGPMNSIEELLLIKGMTPEIYFGDPEKDQFPLTAYFTVHGHCEGAVNANTAPAEVIAAILAGASSQGAGVGDPMDAAMQIFQHAREQPFQQAGELDQYVRPVAQPGTGQPGTGQPGRVGRNPVGQGASAFFVVNSDIFRIDGDGMKDDVMVRVEAYVWRNPTLATGQTAACIAQSTPAELEPFRVLDWKVIR